MSALKKPCASRNLFRCFKRRPVLGWHQFKLGGIIAGEADKVTRFGAAVAMFEAGQLHLPADAHWLAEFHSEILAFPNGRFDDQADALSQLMIWVRNRWRDKPSDDGVWIPQPDPPGGDDGAYEDLSDPEYLGDDYEFLQP